MSVLLARQPIVDATGRLFGYELLFRQPDGSGPREDPGAAGTATVLWNAMIELGIDQFGQGGALFVNVPDTLLSSEALDAVPADRLVVEILETTSAGPEVEAGITALRDRGVRIALDDFDPRTQASLLPLADFVKVEVSDPGSLARTIEMLGERDGRRLIAERVETVEEVDRCRRQGFDLFQGYYFSKPRPMQKKIRTPVAVGQLRILAELQREDITLSDVESLLGRDRELCYRVMHYAASALVSRTRRISTIREAAIAVGMKRLRSLAAMSVVSGISEGEVVRPTQSLVRARFCQKLAEKRGLVPGAAFLVGLFFELETLLGMSGAEFVEQVGLADEAADALLCGRGPLGDLLRDAVAYEGNGAEVSGTPSSLAEAEAYLAAVRWAEALFSNATAS